MQLTAAPPFPFHMGAIASTRQRSGALPFDGTHHIPRQAGLRYIRAKRPEASRARPVQVTGVCQAMGDEPQRFAPLTTQIREARMNRQRLLAAGFFLSVAVPLGAQTAGSI